MGLNIGVGEPERFIRCVVDLRRVVDFFFVFSALCEFETSGPLSPTLDEFVKRACLCYSCLRLLKEMKNLN